MNTQRRERATITVRIDPAVAMLLDLRAERVGSTRSQIAAHVLEGAMLEHRGAE